MPTAEPRSALGVRRSTVAAMDDHGKEHPKPSNAIRPAARAGRPVPYGAGGPECAGVRDGSGKRIEIDVHPIDVRGGGVGCEVEYHVDGRHIEICRMSPTESSDHLPYPQYPALLPYVPLEIGETRRCSYAEFAERFPSMPEHPAELIVVVPAPATLGVSLWGRGDDGDVILLFECDVADRMIYASNGCS